jgi:predicted PolB exonuclease-like 3'-5' exonuclease
MQTSGEHVVFDIETAMGNPPIEVIDTLMTGVKADGRIKDPMKIAQSILDAQNEIKERFGLKWYTGQIICIGIKTTEMSTVFYQEPNRMSEEDILNLAWKFLSTSVKPPFKLITYNGKAFDIPYFYMRSAIYRIEPTIFLSTRKWETNFHTDLYEVLGEKSLSFWAKVFGIPHDDKVNGSMVQELWNNLDMTTIKQHCLDDLETTAELYNRVWQYIQ